MSGVARVIAAMRWEPMDRKAKVLLIPETKTGTPRAGYRSPRWRWRSWMGYPGTFGQARMEHASEGVWGDGKGKKGDRLPLIVIVYPRAGVVCYNHAVRSLGSPT